MGGEADRVWLNGVTKKVIGCAFQVGNTLGAGFLERVYEHALLHELQKSGLRVERQKEIAVFYDGILVGQFYADLLVENTVILELKAVPALENRHFAQCMNYLKATNLCLGLLINFGTPSVEIRRVVRDF